MYGQDQIHVTVDPLFNISNQFTNCTFILLLHEIVQDTGIFSKILTLTGYKKHSEKQKFRNFLEI